MTQKSTGNPHSNARKNRRCRPMFRCSIGGLLTTLMLVVATSDFLAPSPIPAQTRSRSLAESSQGAVKKAGRRKFGRNRADREQNSPMRSGVSIASRLIQSIKKIHPLTLAALQVLLVLLVCFLLTDNQELELYLKIRFRPPRTDILN